jgi:hypothetical protein
MIVWKGWGLMALLIPLLCTIFVGTAVDSIYGVDFYKNSDWAMPLILGLSSIIVFYLGYKLNNKPGRIVIDIETNKTIELKNTHSMFWIPLQYWAVIISAFSIWMYFA